MGNIGMKMSAVNEDVKLAAENKLVFTSKYPALKIHSQGSGSTEFLEVGGDIVIAEHNLGYRPFFAVWVEDTTLASGLQLSPFRVAYDMWRVQYFGSTDFFAPLDRLVLTNANIWEGGFWDPVVALPDRTVNYKWIIFYDTIQA